MKLHLKIINLEGVYLEKDVDFLNINTEAGELTILACLLYTSDAADEL